MLAYGLVVLVLVASAWVLVPKAAQIYVRNLKGDALVRASQNRNLAEARRLLAMGADPNFLAETRPLAYAIQNDDLAMASLLIAHGAEVDGRIVDGVTPLFLATRHDFPRPAIFRLLLSHGANVNAVDDSGRSALFYVPTQTSLTNMKMLLAAGANVNLQDNEGNSPLMALISNPCITSLAGVELLLRSGADPNLVNKQGRTALAMLPYVCQSAPLVPPNPETYGKVMGQLLMKYGGR